MFTTSKSLKGNIFLILVVQMKHSVFTLQKFNTISAVLGSNWHCIAKVSPVDIMVVINDTETEQYMSQLLVVFL